MELRDRLEEILGEGKSEALIKSTGGIQHYVPGQSLLTEYGSCYCVSTEYPAGYMYGHHSLGSVMELDAESVCVAGKDSRFFSFDTKDCIFLDAETTGLHGGAGTCAFLIGVGFYEGDTFHVQQIFMRDYDEETALLSTLSRLVKNRRFIVTYNGKSFDVPLIESRLIMSRMKAVFSSVEHLDLLHAARRVWGRSLEDCRLHTVEQRVLGVKRLRDMPGEEIPSRFFAFVSSGDASGLPLVFEHNRNDVLFLPVLMKEVCGAVKDVTHRTLSPIDLYSIGVVYDSLSKRNETLPFYRKALKSLRGSARAAVAYRLGMTYKRLGRWDEAVSAWKRLLESDTYGAYEELAKYYEHVSRELDEAEAVVVKALNIFRGTIYEGKLEHRRRRIVRKLRPGVHLGS
ncbi:hypothetical protein E3J62_03315 [candidate division TA06 bacterium]|uniref:YprB ribonuclease H-like domain-containing protein n=1 Tax=candidate division TA06 bacterium TaxID=2250710 RepID=A0A523UVS0_UNCT6|nr:MAG: hypothetical protein E3J62_03315 [candidate division TA06 bacterium]